MALKRSVNAYETIDMPRLDEQPEKKLTPRGVRPESKEELEAWLEAAVTQHVSMHQFMLYAVRDLVVRTMQGFRIPQEQVTTTQIKRPKGKS